MEVMENPQVVWDLSDLYCLCSALVLFPNIMCLPSQSNRELEDCAMGCCEKHITVAQRLILEAYLKTSPFHTVKDHRATKLVGSSISKQGAKSCWNRLVSVSLVLLERKEFPSSF